MSGIRRQDHADTAHNLPEMCVSLFFSFLILMQTAQVSPIQLRIRRQSTSCAHMRSIPYYTSSPFTDGALHNNAAPARNTFPFVHKPNALNRDRIVVPTAWCAPPFRRKSGGKGWEDDILFDVRIDSDITDGARKMFASLGAGPAPRSTL